MLKESESSILIQLKNIKKSFTTSAGTFDALRGVDLVIKKGEFISVVGKSGSGKTTLMNMISGIDTPSSGEVIIEGKSIQRLSQNKLSKWRGTSVGVVFQFFQLLPTLSVLENVMLPMDFGNTYAPGERKDRAMDLLREVGIEDQAYKFPTALSGGQQQRAAIARALANDPPILIADEPTGNLDSTTAEDVLRIFQQLVKREKTVILVTHDQDIAGQCNRKVTLADGRII